MKRIEAVTAADVAELAGELLAPERLSVAGIGPDERTLPRRRRSASTPRCSKDAA